MILLDSDSTLVLPKTFDVYPLYFKEIFGHTHPEIFAAYVTFAILGALLFMFMRATKKASSAGPVKTTWASMIKNKFLRSVTNFILVFILMLVYIRFTPELLGMAVSSGIAFGIGLCNELLLIGIEKFYSIIQAKIISKKQDQDN